jgi:hypothetical protein
MVDLHKAVQQDGGLSHVGVGHAQDNIWNRRLGHLKVCIVVTVGIARLPTATISRTLKAAAHDQANGMVDHG